MKTFSTTCVIDATPTTVWSVLTDLQAWPKWNSTVPKVEGTVALGNRITVYTTASPGRAFPVKVTTLNAPREMLWTGGMPFGLFIGQRTYTLTEHAPGKTTFTMTEDFSGLLAPFITKSIPDLQPLFVEFAACLKRASEFA